jgi:hypothetical protein
MTPAGFPHSEISGSKPVCGSPELIAAYHVLHRLSAPRHPPYALSSLTKLAALEVSTNPIASNPIQLSKIVVLGSLGSALGSISLAESRANHSSQKRTLQRRRSRTRFGIPTGGADRIRTDDFRLARAALSQLSYSPSPKTWAARMVGLGRLELPTSRLSGVRSNQLSYRPTEGCRFPGN